MLPCAVVLDVLGQLLGPGLAVGRADAFADGDQAAAMLRVDAIDVGEELLFADRRSGT